MSRCSIRQRLTIWYAISLVLILFFSGLFWYLHLSRSLLEQTDGRLRAIATELSDARIRPPGSGEHSAPDCDLSSVIGKNTWSEYIQILDDRGEISSHSSNLGELHLPLSKMALTHSRQGKFLFEDLEFSDGRPLRLLTWPVTEQGQTTALIQVATDLTPNRKTLNHLLLILGIFSPIAVAILSFGGWLLAKQALGPVDRIIRQVNDIDVTRLGQRLPKPESRDEIGRLVETFNSMLDRLEESFNKVRQFTADASHELRTPLAILQGETEVCLRWAKDLDEYRQTLGSNLEEINRMGRIIEDLLTLSKEEAGTAPLVLEDFSLADLLQDLYLQGNSLGAPKGIDVSLSMEVTEDTQMRGDRWRLHQLLLNLVANGVKYTPEGGRVKIILSLEGGNAVVSVSDTGIGIAAEHLPHIFDRFYRTDEARNRAEGGTGLGLAIAQLIAKAHGGRIEVASEPDKGSTFTAYLPLAGPDQSILEKPRKKS